MNADEVNLAKTMVNESQYVGNKFYTNSAVPGRLSKDSNFAEFYLNVLNAEWVVVDIMKWGYTIPFLQKPPAARFTVNNCSCTEQLDFAVSEVHRLMLKGRGFS